MKKITTLLLLIIGFSINAQTINIPDPAFKAYLITNLGVDTNNDGEIQLSEAQEQTFLSLGNSAITNLEGLQYFTNVTYLMVSETSVTTLDISTMTQLHDLYINNYTSLNTLIINAPNLTYLDINNSGLISLDLTNSPAIWSCYITNCSNLVSLTASTLIDLSLTNTNLASFNCNILHGDIDLSNNQLTSFNVNYCDAWNLDLSNNLLTYIDLTMFDDPSNSNYVILSNNLFTSFDFSEFNFPHSFTCLDSPNLTSIIMPTHLNEGWGYREVFISGPNLNFVDFKNGICDVYYNMSGMPYGYGNGTSYYISGSPDLFFCVDEGCGEYSNSGDYRDEEFYFSHLGLFSDTPLNVNTPRSRHASPYCSFLPGGAFNTIQGSVTWDCGNSNSSLSNIKLNFGSPNEYTFSNDSGNFVYYLGQGNYTLTPQFENSSYFTISPANYNFNLTSTGNTETTNFCISPNGVHNDLNLTLIPISVARPGFDAEYILALKNNGNQTQSGTVSLTFDDAKADYVSSLPNITSQNSNVLNWDFTGLEPFETKVIHVTLNVNSPTETPAVNIGNVLEFSSEVTSPGTDETPSDNLYSFNQVVVGSYDPNDKQVVEGSQVDISKSGDYLTYIVRFQNTGNYSAENVVVKDYLSPYLDLNTLQMVSSSHPFRCTLTQSNRLEFFFEGINLPASSIDEHDSHGYICFKIKPKANTISLGTTINNKASIYFDYNDPINTNTVSTTFSALSNNDLSFDGYFNLSPNPTSSILNLHVKNEVNLKSLEIYNPLGQLVLTKESDINATNIPLDVTGLKDGVYVISIVTDKGKTSKRFIKK